VDLICSAVYPFQQSNDTVLFRDKKYSHLFGVMNENNILLFQCLKNANETNTILRRNFPANREVSIKVGAMSDSLQTAFLTEDVRSYQEVIHYMLSKIDIVRCQNQQFGDAFVVELLSASYATALMTGIASLKLSDYRYQYNDLGLRISREELQKILYVVCTSIYDPTPFSTVLNIYKPT
jgi:hypothetical protein